ncbi:aminopeptidase P family protein [Angustibacter sp. Root456]|uniref:aminopeptidase P family protein n=1 Tax=Angustibacter sp. Root456 TaxID=1736539 RepID=UPI0006FD7226|nr:aminopeptidase P family protein [Angustibacter sp. Root456]KQX65801.1 Xaa-Pro aminopeptidase [Angustibacter sp. Root456]
MSEQQPKKTDHRTRPTSEAFKSFIAGGWAPRPSELPARADVATYAAQRRAAVSQAFAGERVVVPAGGLKVRSNDTDYVFRPHSAFSYLTGLGADREPDSVLVLEPVEGGGHEAVLYFRPRAGRDTEEFYADARYGELWVGVRPSLEEIEAELAITARHLDELPEAVKKDLGLLTVRVVRDADPDVTATIDQAREQSQERDVEADRQLDDELGVFLSEMRLTKDEWEIEQMRLACAATADGFEAMVRSFPDAVAKGRGERWVEGQFGLVARHSGNGVGYDSIVAAGDHACTLHWIRNTGDVRDGDLLLIDAGVEVDSLYTADVTRTLPVNGRFSEVQRKVYEAVLEAQEAGIAAVKPGNKFKDVHEATIRVIAAKLVEWGLLPVDVEATLGDEGGHHRRWMVHGTSHHLGIDVHDCAQARREQYLEAELKPGMVLTVEPGLYFKADDELVPPELRGIGVRIEDDVLVTEDGCENLSSALPRTPDDVERWMAQLLP